MKGEDGYYTQEQACILPTVSVSKCVCDGTTFTVLPGKPVILININGRYDLHQPLYVCQTCQQQRTPDMKDFLQSGYWPASVNTSTLYTLDLLSSFQELKVISPGFSRQAFAKLLEHRTKCGGRCGSLYLELFNSMDVLLSEVYQASATSSGLSPATSSGLSSAFSPATSSASSPASTTSSSTTVCLWLVDRYLEWVESESALKERG
ncbi:unnamed protein product [Boreogadus saida]